LGRAAPPSPSRCAAYCQRKEVKPVLCFQVAFEALETRVEDKDAPPESHLVPKPAAGEIVNTRPL
jgi:hypothetical protein